MTWPVLVDAADVGISLDVLHAADAEICANRPESRSLLVLRHGQLVFERYYPGVERDICWGEPGPGGSLKLGEPYPVGLDATSPHNVKSVTKSVLSSLVGIALAEGVLDDIDAPISRYLGDYLAGSATPGVGEITLRHLLMMRSGLYWEENGPITLEWIGRRDLVAFTLQHQPVLARPGERWEYSTADTHLLGSCLSRAAGMSLLEYANTRLLSRLGFVAAQWLTDPTGNQVGGSELFLTPHAMAAFGQLYLQRGRWDGTQLVPSDWVELSTTPQPDVTAELLRERSQVQWPPGMRTYREGYGYLWWPVAFGDVRAFAAQGYGGQTIVVVPALDLVVVETMSTDLDETDPPAPARLVSHFSLIDDFVLPAVTA